MAQGLPSFCCMESFLQFFQHGILSLAAEDHMPWRIFHFREAHHHCRGSRRVADLSATALGGGGHEVPDRGGVIGDLHGCLPQ